MNLTERFGSAQCPCSRGKSEQEPGLLGLLPRPFLAAFPCTPGLSAHQTVIVGMRRTSRNGLSSLAAANKKRNSASHKQTGQAPVKRSSMGSVERCAIRRGISPPITTLNPVKQWLNASAAGNGGGRTAWPVRPPQRHQRADKSVERELSSHDWGLWPSPGPSGAASFPHGEVETCDGSWSEFVLHESCPPERVWAGGGTLPMPCVTEAEVVTVAPKVESAMDAVISATEGARAWDDATDTLGPCGERPLGSLMPCG